MTSTSFRDIPQIKNELSIREDIFGTITNVFGIHIDSYCEIKLGYLNLKWKVQTNIGDIFVKQYSKTRYPDSMIKRLETSLNRQTFLNEKGIPCPRLMSHEGKHVLLTSNGERFVIMRMCDGKVIEPGTANVKQLFHLGQIVGQMHKILNDHQQSRIPLHWDIVSKESMQEHWRKRWEEANSVGCDETITALNKQQKVIEEIDLSLFSACEIGWAHWDLFADNILFKMDAVSAILDFDRMNYVYQEFDISRPILSCCLYKGELDLDKVSAFVQGFRETQLLSVDKIVRSIKLTWWKEATMLKVEGENDSIPLRRFQVENKWVADNWNRLNELFADL
ncbi:phosphotransferase [Sporosarcina sp. Marseille-Q4063]|uniref:phosphotransferase n=1 Tax=Sporosarcina sp. Marseille-Q4063 TaxID=2810514 RepID=UPI001BAE8CA4|nr:phosphotransferase [Sporosarcina sp. Marseille-Q4063]QUW20842.1 phosphotransferase [Sporosarcina sp. Marseille-Q4063]